MGWLDNAAQDAKEKKKKAEKENYQPTPKWLLKKWGAKQRAARATAAEVVRERERRKRRRKAKRSARIRFLNSGSVVTLADGDENWREREYEG